MAEHPILFSADMVRAILAGRKTQTRRVIKLPVEACDVQMWSPPGGRSKEGWADPGVNYWTDAGNHIDPCPYGQPGDRLWVRETFAPMCREADPFCWCETEEQMSENHYFEYRADTGGQWPGHWEDAEPDVRAAMRKEGSLPVWKPSIHMPRAASRLTLQITDIRVERLQEISPADYRAEGIEISWPAEMNSLDVEPMLKRRWIDLWDSINAKRGFSWESNPWVWVIEFEVVS